MAGFGCPPRNPLQICRQVADRLTIGTAKNTNLGAQWVEIIYKVHSDSLFDVVQKAVDEAVRGGTLPSDPPAGA